MININFISENITYILTAIFCLSIIYRFLHNKFSTKYSHKWRKKSAAKILQKIKNMNDAQVFTYLRKIDPFVMEELVLSALDKREDIEIKRNKRYTNDNGVDGRFYHYKIKDDKKIRLKYVIQVKRYKSYINPKHAKEFSEQIKNEKAYSGFFIHTGKTSKELLSSSELPNR